LPPLVRPDLPKVRAQWLFAIKTGLKTIGESPRPALQGGTVGCLVLTFHLGPKTSLRQLAMSVRASNSELRRLDDLLGRRSAG
jgi:hypothetical protein